MGGVDPITESYDVFSIKAAAIKKLVARAKKRGKITYEEISAYLLPEDKGSFELIEDIMSQLSEMGVSIVEAGGRDGNANSLGMDANGASVSLGHGRAPAPPQFDGTVFERVEKEPPEYDNRWRVQYGEHPTAEKLTVSFVELKSLNACNNIDWVRQTYFHKVGVDDQLSARDAQIAGCGFDNVLWATGMLSAYSPLAAARLTDFAADCLQLLADRLERDRPERDTILDTVRATRDFAAGKCSVHALLREMTKAQQAWVRIVMPVETGIRFPWVKFFSNDHEWSAVTFLPSMWEEWAKGVAWSVETSLALRPSPWASYDDGAWQHHKEHEDWLLSRLVHRFAPEGPMALPTHLDGDPLISAEKRVAAVVQSINLDGVVFAVLPDDCRRIESISVTNGMSCDLPYSLRSIGSLSLYRCNNTVNVPDGVLQVEVINVDESYLVLPSSVERVGKLTLHLFDESLGCDGVREFGAVELQYAYFTFPEGVEAISSLKIQASDAHLPASLKTIGDIFVDDESRDDIDEPARTLFWKEGPTEVGHLELGEEIHMELPRSIQTIASVRLAQGAYLKLSLDTVIIGPCEVADGATLDRMPALHYENMERIDP
ncbi:RNA polymerase sigma factor region1.1 domain-containing protein [Sphingomonas sp. LY160]|uniref:RNA polymerase sigma factor region1.1 domain-containing protein n=1 Tax=Sphingomonas sp. LY160 TaxID=3095342 RepID=UPI002ADEF134|nr:RNA polymerase sigma factor region1.1 domain-containing protein [Sphingomonas sp. LY160]MEA1071763.1 RNA polymerase sigma factor region1.1 domain-containing protein [Sphingomonas sp. LY160]